MVTYSIFNPKTIRINGGMWVDHAFLKNKMKRKKDIKRKRERERGRGRIDQINYCRHVPWLRH